MIPSWAEQLWIPSWAGPGPGPGPVPAPCAYPHQETMDVEQWIFLADASNNTICNTGRQPYSFGAGKYGININGAPNSSRVCVITVGLYNALYYCWCPQAALVAEHG